MIRGARPSLLALGATVALVSYGVNKKSHCAENLPKELPYEFQVSNCSYWNFWTASFKHVPGVK